MAGDEADLLAAVIRWFPIRLVEADIHAPVVFDGVFMEGSEGTLQALQLVAEIALVESRDPSRHFHGILHEDVAPEGDMASTTQPIGVTVLAQSRLDGPGEQRTNSEVIAHELGHNFALRHAPCGGVQCRNEDYPYPDGVIGTHGYDYKQHRIIAPDTADFLGYCWPWWISDYRYGHIIDFRNNHASETTALGTTVQTQVLLLSGTIDKRYGSNEVLLRPAFTLQAVPRPPRDGGWTVELMDDAGGSLKRITFEPDPLSEAGLYNFDFSVALVNDVLDKLTGIRVIDPEGNSHASQVAGSGGLTTLAQAAEFAATRLSAAEVPVTWNSAHVKAVIVRDADSGMVLGQGSSGQLRLPFGGRRIEVLGSDEVRTYREELTVP